MDNIKNSRRGDGRDGVTRSAMRYPVAGRDGRTDGGVGGRRGG